MMQDPKHGTDKHRTNRLHNKALRSPTRQTRSRVSEHIFHSSTEGGEKTKDFKNLCSFCHLLFKFGLGRRVFLHV